MAKITFEMTAIKDKLPEAGQRCLINTAELDYSKFVFATHSHDDWFDCVYPCDGRLETSRVRADYWAHEIPVELQHG